MSIEFSKMNSNGNDFLITENANIFSADISHISDRNSGIGFDQILWVDPTPSKFRVKIINSDGSSAQTCFNGLRCIAGLYNLNNQIISAPGGDVLCRSDGDMASVCAEFPKIKLLEKLSIADIGNNHAIYEVTEIHNYDLEGSYKSLEQNPTLPPNINLNVYEDMGDFFKIRTFENGAGETKSCGSGTVCTFAILNKLKNINQAIFLSEGGKSHLRIENNIIVSTAPYILEYEGSIDE
ncbi:MAG: hypothetical protein O3C54_00285 [Proteobacteria bacterium]|nr:hypothetical protein [Pseudomonadota bacterium]MDA0899606.1 hypothetical protein [Pseudomonadota bacterium]MDA1056551.1 hypothetical protein [Pseudomonadota bacterium]